MQSTIWKQVRDISPTAKNLLCELEKNCNLCSGGSVNCCYNSIVSLTTISCDDFQQIVSELPAPLVDAFCQEIQNLINYINSPVAAQDLAGFLSWYQNVFAPCVSQVCQNSHHPIRADDIRQAPANLLRKVVESEIPATNLFFMQYGLAITLILSGVIFVLIIMLILKKK